MAPPLVASQCRREMTRTGRTLWVAIVGAAALLGGCGYTDLEMAAKQRQIDALTAQVSAMRAGASAACQIPDAPSKRATSTHALSSR